jgi:hypothetical protein
MALWSDGEEDATVSRDALAERVRLTPRKRGSNALMRARDALRWRVAANGKSHEIRRVQS